MLLRAYVPLDADSTATVFERAVREIASREYTAPQIEAWAESAADLHAWGLKRCEAATQVAVAEETLAGFIGLLPGGFIDMLFVNPDFSRRGVASRLLEWAEAEARRVDAATLSTNASKTAVPFLLDHGFAIEHEQTVTLRGIDFVNFHMTRPLE